MSTITVHELPRVPVVRVSGAPDATFPVEEYGAEANFIKGFNAMSAVTAERIMEDHIKRSVNSEACGRGSTDVWMSTVDVKRLPPPLVDPDDFYKRHDRYRALCRVAFAVLPQNQTEE